MDREQILALTMENVRMAKERAAVARQTRSGLNTIDFHLVKVGETVNGKKLTLDDAKNALLADFHATSHWRKK